MTITSVRKKGQFTIPVEIRESMDIQENDPLTVFSLNNKAMIVIPQKIRTLEILRKTAQMAKKRGLTMEEMFEEIEEVRRNA
ncbi:MAG: AbrB/MazE/SpoVT family DNA-binding domain-containing protein [Candidatus Gracilibacteria bacterium]|jgi:AbrB family looped-hinge helix DNA binding protein